ncbi:hypothetical protein PFICI_02461 [Pestalotiopsis fici W106-1]|uniref:Phosphogluconate dehydrogenase NAD-binding putative C-terminal domain-containing protein n=1 Tax=Pestalotiopsis fici (strain W106-1 / CGMCC3.15140) TaxID=1229662 RepID=W3XGT5_PESFW|nr:uncharacterized protein PFICI_02461 [Pestalotiopsis fici W106-1]ETS84436.1 hypothetical protein PFICI_02461 [Pestalotiopsis fici W106-1]
MAPSEKVGIVSIGEMGVGVAKLLVAHGYTVLTNITGRSEYTQRRATTASIVLLGSDEDLVSQADYLLSIVPPRDALATAERFAGVKTSGRIKPLYYLDLNATSPKLARKTAEIFRQNAPGVKYVDGGIIGGPPRVVEEQDCTQSATPTDIGVGWARPSIPLSGPHELPNEHLAKVLNVTHVGPEVGSASGLKCCFGSIIKGLIAISIQSFSTAEALGVYGELQRHLEMFQPALQKSTTRMVTEIPPKAGRWVDEMWEIGRCFGEDGGWDNVTGDEGADVYKRIAEVYRTIADDTVLGKERPEHRVRGKTADDVAVAIVDALKGGKGAKPKDH